MKRIELRVFDPPAAAVPGIVPDLTIPEANFAASGSARTISSSIALASLWRRKGSLNNARPMTPRTALSIAGLIDLGEGGCSSTTLRAISAAVEGGEGSRPVGAPDR